MVSFFYPLMWLAAATLAVPLWLHLRRKDESHVVRFSAMRFLDEQPLARRSPLRLQDLPLLLLRMLLLLLLTAAFAWPILPGANEALIRESRVFILDNTLSHQAGGRFTTARDEIAEAIGSAGLDTQIAVAELKSSPRVLVQFGDDAAVAAARVRNLRPAFARGSYAEAFRLARQLLEQALGEERRIVLAGDSQANQWDDDATVPPFLAGVTVDLPEVTTDELPNLALRSPVVKRVNQAGKSVVQCAVRVYRLGDAQTARVTVVANDRPIVERELELTGQEREQTLQVEFDDDPSEWLRGKIRLSGHQDALAGDDEVFFSLPPLRPSRVAVLADSIYLRTVLSAEVLGSRWICQQLAAESVQSHELAGVLCIESQFLASGKVRDVVKEYLASGRGVAIFVGPSRPAVAGLLRDFGIELLGQPNSPSKPSQPEGFRYIYLEHPIFRPVRGTDFGDLSEVTINRYRRLEVPGAVPLAFSASGDPLLMESTLSRGRLLVFAFQLDRAETNWPLHPTFVPFLDGCLQHLSSTGTDFATEYEPGESCVWSIPADADANDVVRIRRGGTTDEIQRLTVNNGQVRCQLPDAPGHYELLYGPDDETQVMLNVNTPPAESELIFTAKPETLENWQQDTASLGTADSEKISLTELSRLEILRQQYWWWLMVAGLVFLVVETAWISQKQGYAR